jgi:hypothetical protein
VELLLNQLVAFWSPEFKQLQFDRVNDSVVRIAGEIVSFAQSIAHRRIVTTAEF